MVARRWADDERADVEESLTREHGDDPALLAFLRGYMDGGGPDAERRKPPPEAIGRRPRPAPALTDATTARRAAAYRARRDAGAPPVPVEESTAPGKAASDLAIKERDVARAARHLERLRREGMEGTGRWRKALGTLTTARRRLTEARRHAVAEPS